MMPSTAFDAKTKAVAPDAIAPDGSEVRLLCATGRASTAVFTLPPGAVARAVSHRTVEEIWYVIEGRGRLWRELDGREEIIALAAGISATIPVGARFQFRNDGVTPLHILGATMPPWPGGGEAMPTDGPWPPHL